MRGGGGGAIAKNHHRGTGRYADSFQHARRVRRVELSKMKCATYRRLRGACGETIAVDDQPKKVDSTTPESFRHVRSHLLSYASNGIMYNVRHKNTRRRRRHDYEINAQIRDTNEPTADYGSLLKKPRTTTRSCPVISGEVHAPSLVFSSGVSKAPLKR